MASWCDPGAPLPYDPPTADDEHHLCAQFLRDALATKGCDAHVTELPPLVHTIWTSAHTCPHKRTLYAEPTGEQRAAWARDGVR